MSELDLYKMEQLAQRLSELEKLNQLVPLVVMAFVGVIALAFGFFMYLGFKEKGDKDGK